MYFFLKDFNYSETNFGSSVIDVFTQKVTFKVNLLPRLLLLLTFTGTNLRIAYLIFQKSGDTNHYYQRIRNWTKTVVLLEFMAVGLFSIMNSFLISYDGGNIMLILIAFLVLLMVLYRPRFINSQSIKLSLSSDFKKQDDFSLTDTNFYAQFFILFVISSAGLFVLRLGHVTSRWVGCVIETHLDVFQTDWISCDILVPAVHSHRL
jgi:hypothetical protein